MKKKLHVVIAVVICAALCVGYYFYLSNRNTSLAGTPTEMEQLLNKDLESSYPTTPREVLSVYNRILLCLFSGDWDDEEFEKLADQARELMDPELLEQNPRETHLHDLKAEVNNYLQEGKEFISVRVSSSKDVEKKTVNGSECAYVEAIYSVKGKKDTEQSRQTYVLRKGEDGRWRILGFYQP